MEVYVVQDHSTCRAKSIHFAVDEEAAIQAHLVHYGLLGLDERPKVRCVGGLPRIRRDRICWDVRCVLTGASVVEE